MKVFVVISASIIAVLIPGCTDLRNQESGKAPTPKSNGAGNEAAAIGSRLTRAEMQQLLSLHNEARQEVRVSPLTWSEDLAIYAQEWADHLAANDCNLEHRPVSGKWQQKYGENLWQGGGRNPVVGEAVAAWATEKKYYHGGVLNASNWSTAGHYTQIVWENSKQLGCAKVICNGKMIVVCNYDPPGNVLGEKPY